MPRDKSFLQEKRIEQPLSGRPWTAALQRHRNSHCAAFIGMNFRSEVAAYVTDMQVSRNC